MIAVAEPTLAKPGAGLPFIEWFVANYILMPRMLHRSTRQTAINQFTREAERIKTLASALNPEELTERKLIKRLTGLEDSSRYWSVAMTMQHLVIVNTGIRATVIDLCNGGTDRPKAQVQDVKPSAEVNGEVIRSEFEVMCKKFLHTAETAKVEAHPEATFDHPWFGPFNAQDWLAMAGFHQKIHRTQIEAIIYQLSR